MTGPSSARQVLIPPLRAESRPPGDWRSKSRTRGGVMMAGCWCNDSFIHVMSIYESVFSMDVFNPFKECFVYIHSYFPEGFEIL